MQTDSSSAPATANNDEPAEQQHMIICGRCSHPEDNCPSKRMPTTNSKKWLAAMAAEPDQDSETEATATFAGTIGKSSERDVSVGDARASQHMTLSR